MHVRNGFARIRAMIDDQSESFAPVFDAELVRDLARGEEQGSELRLILGGCIPYPWNRLARHDENMNRSLRRDVIEGTDKLVFIDNAGRDFTVDDSLEQGLVTHGNGFD